MKIIKAFLPISEREIEFEENIKGTVKSLTTISEKDLPGELSLYKTVEILNNLRKKTNSSKKWYIIVLEIQTTENDYYIQSTKYLGYYELDKIINPHKRNNDLILKPIELLFPNINS